ncbi:MAG TPA: hypothetical protein VGA99_14670 [bacterium]
MMKLVKNLALALLVLGAIFGPAFAQTKFSAHGYLTQAFAISDGNQYFGIPSDGTTDYRKLALQFRYDLDPHNNIVIQFSHLRLGRSSLNDAVNPIELDWAFAEHRFSESLALKFGRVLLPLGIYNEIRDVGTLLPFYSPCMNVYGDVAWTNETVDGILIRKIFAADSPWNLKAELYFGHWTRFEYDLSMRYQKAEIDNGLGMQLWLNTPVQGLRFGVAGNRQRVTGGLYGNNKFYDELFLLSFEGNFERFSLHSEYMEVRRTASKRRVYYGYAGLNLSHSLSLHAEADFVNVLAEHFLIGKINDQWNTDYMLGINYRFHPNFVAKLEGHYNRGFFIEGQAVNPFVDDKYETLYSIASLSASF